MAANDEAPSLAVAPATVDYPCIIAWNDGMTRAEDDLRNAVVVTVVSDRYD